MPAEEIAIESGSPKCANMVMLGAYLGKRGHLTADQAAAALPDVLASATTRPSPLTPRPSAAAPLSSSATLSRDPAYKLAVIPRQFGLSGPTCYALLG